MSLGGKMFAHAVRDMAQEAERTARLRAKVHDRLLATAEDWRAVARAALIVASWAEQYARELDGADEFERPPVTWFHAARSAWRDAQRVVGLSFKTGAVIDWTPTEPPEVDHG